MDSDINRSQTLCLIRHSPLEPTLLTSFPPRLPRRHQSDGNEIAHTRLRASTRDLRASPKPTSKSTIEEDLKKLIDLESPTPESQKNFKVEGRLWGNGREKLGMMGCRTEGVGGPFSLRVKCSVSAATSLWSPVSLPFPGSLFWCVLF